MRRLLRAFLLACWGAILFATPAASIGGQVGVQRPASGAGGDAKKPRMTASFLLRSAAAGAFAGTMLESVLYPVETIKTRLQTSGASAVKAAPLSLRSAFSGIVGNSLASVAGSFLFFMIYEPTRTCMQGVTENKALIHFIGATFGLLTSSLISVPNDVVKTRMQSGRSTNALATVRHVLKSDGVMGFYTGGPAWLMLNLPKTQFAFVLYEVLRALYVARFAQDRPMTPLENSMVGCTQGIMNGLILTPIDTVRARLMVQGLQGAPQYKGAFDAFRCILRNEGVKGVFAGAVARMVWMGGRGAVFFTSLEAARRLFLPEVSR